MKEKIPLFIVSDTLQMGDPVYYQWNYRRFPNVLLVGSTGSGKTYAGMLLCARVAKHIPCAQITVCDFKADDWTFLRDSQRYFEFSACMDGLEQFYSILVARQQGVDPSRYFRMLVFDEFASFLNSLPKKEADSAKTRLSTLLMLGRAYNIHTCVIQQRGDSEYFAKSRDNFNIIVGMGNLSKEQKSMLFQDFKDEMVSTEILGAGYISEDSARLVKIQVPLIASPAAMQDTISGVV